MRSLSSMGPAMLLALCACARPWPATPCTTDLDCPVGYTCQPRRSQDGGVRPDAGRYCFALDAGTSGRDRDAPDHPQDRRPAPDRTPPDLVADLGRPDLASSDGGPGDTELDTGAGLERRTFEGGIDGGLEDSATTDGSPGDAGAADAGSADVAHFVEEQWLRVKQVAAGGAHTCALHPGGEIRCWGSNAGGQLGLGDTLPRGTEMVHMGAALPAVPLGQAAVAVVVGAGHSCALLDDGTVKCWGLNDHGQLGQGHDDDLGGGSDDVTTLQPVPLPIEGPVTRLIAGAKHNCALSGSGELACWGHNASGQLGLGDNADRGDDPDEIPLVGEALQFGSIGAGVDHSCGSVVSSGSLLCWGSNDFGQLGVAPPDSPVGAAWPEVLLPTGTEQVVVGGHHNCALTAAHEILCWGRGVVGQLGNGQVDAVGDNDGEMPPTMAVELGFIPLGVEVELGKLHSCALLRTETGQRVKCWGSNNFGQLGLGDTRNRGILPEDLGANLPFLDLGAQAPTSLDLGTEHSCALFQGGRIKCWGANFDGRLGLGDTKDRGDGPDDQDQSEMGDHLPFVDLGDCEGAPDYTPCGHTTRDLVGFSHKLCLQNHCRLPCCGADCTIPGPRWAPPDTGQQSCYNDTAGIPCPPEGQDYHGQDAQYPDPPEPEDPQHPRFVRLSDNQIQDEPFVMDNVTDLEWQGCLHGRRGANCDESYMTPYMLTWQTALEQCEGQTWAGHTDWRLPDLHELQSIADYDGGWAVDDELFPINAPVWSSSPSPPGHVWVYDFTVGLPFRSQPTSLNKLTFMCVRGGKECPVEERFVVTEQSEPHQRTVTDEVTHLTWTGCRTDSVSGQCSESMFFESCYWGGCLSGCEQLIWGGRSDWRLPSFNELMSAIDSRTGRLAFDRQELFPAGSAFASSTTRPDDAQYAMGWRADGTTYFQKSGPATTFIPLCVRNAP